MKLAGKSALITGAGSGIGAAAAHLMAAEGASVALCGIPSEGVERVATELRELGARAVALPADVRDATQMTNAVRRTVEEFGALDILVASAGIQMHREDREVHKLPEEVWDRTHDVNYRGVFLTCKAGLAQMVNQETGGVVVIISSVTALNGRTPNVAYASGKHGLIGLGRNIAVHYAKYGIRCNIVCPGALERTPNWEDHPDPEGRLAELQETIPLGRPGRPEEIASFVTFLATPEASYATGATFVIDGGLSVA